MITMSLVELYNKFIQDYGFKVLITKQDPTQVCSCNDLKTRSSKPNCPFCFGTGFVSTVEERLVRIKVGSVPVTLPNATRAEIYGTDQNSARFFYIEKGTVYHIGDLIYDRDEDIIYEINSIEPLRLANNEIIYYRLATSNMSIKAADSKKNNILQAF